MLIGIAASGLDPIAYLTTLHAAAKNTAHPPISRLMSDKEAGGLSQ